MPWEKKLYTYVNQTMWEGVKINFGQNWFLTALKGEIVQIYINYIERLSNNKPT